MTNPRSATLLLIDDHPDYLTTVAEALEDAGYTVLKAQSATEARRVVASEFIDLVIADNRLGGAVSGTDLLAEWRAKLPGLGGILVSAYADLETAVRAMRAGVLDLLQKPVSGADLLLAVARTLAESELIREVRYDRWRASTRSEFPEIIGADTSLRRVLAQVVQVARTSASVLIEGESGTGKELVARAIHARSDRSGRSFVAVNAGALPPALLESTLFGSKKGAYTDAKADRPGYFETAHGGTLFLDEIGETTPELQVRLLRVLQEKKVTRVGDTREIDVNVRVIAATNRDLRLESTQNRFRPDLYFRLAVLTISLPPLRERIEDIAALTRHFIATHAQELGRPIKRISDEAMEMLKRYPWPGNVRELDNVVQRAVILAEGEDITLDALSLEPASGGLRDIVDLLDQPYRDAVKAFNRRYFQRLMARAGGNKTKAADLAGVDRTVIYDHLNRLT